MADRSQTENRSEAELAEEQHATIEEVSHKLGDEINEFGFDGPQSVMRFIRGVNQEREAEVLFAADNRGKSADNPAVYLSLHVAADDRSAALLTEYLDEPDSAYVDHIDDVSEVLAELLERDDVWVVRGDEDEIEIIESYQ